MRISLRWGSARMAALVAAVLAVTACGGPPPSSPVADATPRITPNPHLASPATADQVFRALSAGGLRIVANNAVTGENGEPVKRINATFMGWPLDVAQYSTADALDQVTQWKNGEKPTQGEEPIAIVGLNILVTWGPTTGATPPAPDPQKAAGLDRLVAILDPLLSPLRARTVVPVTFPSATAAPTVAPSVVPSSVPSAKPSTKPKATAKPKVTPKP